MRGSKGETPSRQGEIVIGGIQPIRPEEVVGQKMRIFPAPVIEAFNTLITQNVRDGGLITIRQDDVVALMVEKGLTREEIIAKGWLNVEDVYREAGWDVAYDKPGFNESGFAVFTFRPSRKE
jgi:hypothetical protein